jgi:hypothetical protein
MWQWWYWGGEEERRRRSRRNKPILKSRGLNRRRERNYIYV